MDEAYEIAEDQGPPPGTHIEQAHADGGHRWIRGVDPDAGTASHWCLDGDTDHHAEPCSEHPDTTGMIEMFQP